VIIRKVQVQLQHQQEGQWEYSNGIKDELDDSFGSDFEKLLNFEKIFFEGEDEEDMPY